MDAVLKTVDGFRNRDQQYKTEVSEIQKLISDIRLKLQEAKRDVKKIVRFVTYIMYLFLLLGANIYRQPTVEQSHRVNEPLISIVVFMTMFSSCFYFRSCPQVMRRRALAPCLICFRELLILLNSK